MNLDAIDQAARVIVSALLDEPGAFDPVHILVVGCSSSEIAGGVIGKMSSPEIGTAVARAVIDECAARGIFPAFQCCEHLNRALVVPRELALRERLPLVSAVPHPKAGGSTAAAAYRLLESPVLVETLQAEAALDIGQTLIGMHLRPVAIPLRLPITTLGQAPLTAARTRPKYIGGPRTIYT